MDGQRVGIHKFASNWGALGESVDTRSGNLKLLDPDSGSAVADGGGDSVLTFLQFAELAER